MKLRIQYFVVSKFNILWTARTQVLTSTLLPAIRGTSGRLPWSCIGTCLCLWCTFFLFASWRGLLTSPSFSETVKFSRSFCGFWRPYRVIHILYLFLVWMLLIPFVTYIFCYLYLLLSISFVTYIFCYLYLMLLCLMLLCLLLLYLMLLYLLLRSPYLSVYPSFFQGF